MSDFVGFDLERVVLAHLRAEMRKDVLEAAEPRYLSGLTIDPAGGYGFDFTGMSKWLPWTFVNDVHAAEGVPLCPTFEAASWVDLETGEAIDDEMLVDPFVGSELRDLPEVGEVRNGAGFMSLSSGDVGLAETNGQGLGAGGQLSMSSPLEIQISVPSGRGRGQLNVYTGILSAIFFSGMGIRTDSAIWRVWDGVTPELVRVDEINSSWLRATVVVPATREYQPRAAL